MLLHEQHSALLIVDIQERLIDHIDENAMVVKNSAWLIQIAKRLNIPTILSEQYPKGLGPTVAAIKEHCAELPYAEKMHFSCTEDPTCMQLIENTQRSQIVLVGIETHVCILQTAIGLLEANKDVFVVADAVSSRTLQDKHFALDRMRDVGVSIVTREMVLFEWLRKAGTPLFKELSQTFLK